MRGIPSSLGSSCVSRRDRKGVRNNSYTKQFLCTYWSHSDTHAKSSSDPSPCPAVMSLEDWLSLALSSPPVLLLLPNRRDFRDFSLDFFLPKIHGDADAADYHHTDNCSQCTLLALHVLVEVSVIPSLSCTDKVWHVWQLILTSSSFMESHLECPLCFHLFHPKKTPSIWWQKVENIQYIHSSRQVSQVRRHSCGVRAPVICSLFFCRHTCKLQDVILDWGSKVYCRYQQQHKAFLGVVWWRKSLRSTKYNQGSFHRH